MVVGGFQKISLSDFPGVISSIVFTRGCGFRCPWCHNPELVDPFLFGPAIPWGNVTSFLRSREGRIEGVVVTGGEPTIHADLPDRLAELKSMGFKLKLDTNGSNPRMLRALLDSGVLDFVAMDIKAPLDRYESVVGTRIVASEIAASVDLVIGSPVPNEFRTTLVPELSLDDLRSIGELVRGCRRYVVQPFVSQKTLAPELIGSGVNLELGEAVRHLTAAGYSVEAR